MDDDFAVQQQALVIATQRAAGSFTDPVSFRHFEQAWKRDPKRVERVLGRNVGMRMATMRGLGMVPDVSEREIEFLRAYDELSGRTA